MTETELTEAQVLRYVRVFAEKVKEQTTDTYPEGNINGEFTNRGNKLKFGSKKVHRNKINGHNNDLDDIETIHYNKAQREIFKRRRLDTYNESKAESNTNEEDDEINIDEDLDSDEDPYLGLDLAKILAPIQQGSDLVTRSSISKTYKSDILKRLAQQSIELIAKEQDNVIQLSNLLDKFLGEDSGNLLEAQLLLPDYDHHLTERKAEPTEATAEMEAETNKTEEKESAEDIDTGKRITRKQSTQTQESDPFFALPKFDVDFDYGLQPEDAEEARQLTQIILQRNEEFIRNLSSLRNGLARAQYVKEKLFNWAKEINGDPDESDIYQREKEAAATASAAFSNQQSSTSSNAEKSDSSEKNTPAPSEGSTHPRRTNTRRRH